MLCNNKFNKYNTGDFEWKTEFWEGSSVQKEDNLIEIAKKENFNYNNFDEIASIETAESILNEIGDDEFKFDSLHNNLGSDRVTSTKNINFDKIKVKTKFNK